MRDYLDFYIGGEWVKPVDRRTLDVVNPAEAAAAEPAGEADREAELPKLPERGPEITEVH